MEASMERRSRRRCLGALAALGLGLAVAASGEDEGGPGASAPYQPADPGELRGRSIDPGERSGRSSDPGEHASETSEPSFGGRAIDPADRVGTSRELREVTRPAGQKPAAPAPDETQGPAFLRLPRRPGAGPAPQDPLAERLCAAEHDLDHAQREHERALRDYKRMQRDGYPHGPAKMLVIEHRDVTGRRLARAEEARDALLAEADEQDAELDPAACGEGEPVAGPARGDPQAGEVEDGAPGSPD
jgi:hypothetical protein